MIHAAFGGFPQPESADIGDHDLRRAQSFGRLGDEIPNLAKRSGLRIPCSDQPVRKQKTEMLV